MKQSIYRYFYSVTATVSVIIKVEFSLLIKNLNDNLLEIISVYLYEIIQLTITASLSKYFHVLKVKLHSQNFISSLS